MFCMNCGQQMADNIKFCGGCGANMSGAEGSNTGAATSTSDFDFQATMNEMGSEIVSLVKAPVDTVKNIKSKGNAAYIILGLIVALVAVANVYITTSSVAKFFMGAYADGVSEILGGQNLSIVMSLLINSIVILTATAAGIFLIVNVILKKSNITYMDGLKILIASYTYSTMIVFIGAIVSYIYLPLGILIILISNIAYIILMYSGLNGLKVINENISLYIVLASIAVMGIIQYILISSKIKDMMYMFY